MYSFIPSWVVITVIELGILLNKQKSLYFSFESRNLFKKPDSADNVEILRI